jgi:hypothetical protein
MVADEPKARPFVTPQFPRRDPHDVDCVVDHVSGSLLAFGTSWHNVAPTSQCRSRILSDADDLRKQAEDARQMVGRVLKKEDKAFWLRLAADWAKLAQDADEKPKRR